MSAPAIPPVAVVTGGASGIGRATAELLFERGWNVIVADTTEAPGLERRGTCGNRVVSVKADVTDESSLELLVDRAETEFATVHAVVTCAGTADNGPLQEVGIDRFRRTLEVNLVGTFATCRVFRPLLAASGGAVVTVGSVSGLRGSPLRAAYSASKGGVTALTRQLAVELAPEGVRVNCVAPGSTRTALAERAQGDAREAILRAIPLARYAEPREIAAVICFLAGPESSFVTGQVWGVDGGQLASAGWQLGGAGS